MGTLKEKMDTLRLGTCDANKLPSDKKSFLKDYHKYATLTKKDQFRDDDKNSWADWTSSKNGNDVEYLENFLITRGFMTEKKNKGVFDYVTQAGVRLFQEHTRTFPKQAPSNMHIDVDGVAGGDTWLEIEKWEKEPNKVCEWSPSKASNPDPEYIKWMSLLSKAKEHYKANPGPIMQLVNVHPNPSATKKIDDWNFDRNRIHFIGIRRNQDIKATSRINDDLFILLLNGMVFKFWGSTDPNPGKSRSEEAYLVEGQHEYRFAWHKLSVSASQGMVTYRALKPAGTVLVMRDWNLDNRLDDSDYDKTISSKAKGLESAGDINIHWSGLSRDKGTWSAGCQVIMGTSYTNNNNDMVDCSRFAATNYNQNKAKGAYTFLSDLVLCYSKQGESSLLYTLGRESSLQIEGSQLGENYVIDALKKLKADGANE